MKRLWEVMDTVTPAPAGTVAALARGQAIAVLTLSAAMLAFLAVGYLAPGAGSLLLILAIAGAAAIGGVGSGVTATIAAVVLELWIDHAQALPAPDSLTKALLVAGLGGAISIYARQRAQALGHLSDREAHLQSILDTVPEAMVVIDDRGIVHSFNPAAERTFRVAAAAILGQNVRTLMPDPHRSAHDGYLQTYLGTGERKVIGHRREVTGVRADGSEFPMDLHVGEVIASGRRYFTGFVRDRTPLFEAEKRTLDLRSQLNEVWRLNSVGQMASVLAHELNQPLAAITNYLRAARTLANSRLPADESDLLEAIDKAGDQALRAGDVIRGLRSFVTRGDFDRTPESLRHLISELDGVVVMTARESGIAVAYDLLPGDDRVLVDRIQIQQLIGNLVRNSLEATRSAPVRKLLIRTRRGDGELIVSVLDSGAGIAPEMADRLFEPMATSKAHGMGLGLSISRSIVERHGGRIWTEASELGGAAFCFSLPEPKSGLDTGGDVDDLRH